MAHNALNDIFFVTRHPIECLNNYCRRVTSLGNEGKDGDISIVE